KRYQVMSKQTRYRILERKTASEWESFAVAYQRGDQFVLFSPAWRAHKPLNVDSLEALGSQHWFDDKFRWQDIVEIYPSQATHPIELLKWDRDTRIILDVVDTLANQNQVPQLTAERLRSMIRTGALAGKVAEVVLDRTNKHGTAKPKFSSEKSIRNVTVEV